MLLVAWRLPHNLESTQVSTDAPKVNTKAFQLRRVDFLGAILLAISIVAFLLVLNFASKRLTILDPVVLALCGLWAGSSLLFLLVEAKYASEPIFPLQLLVRRDVLTAYLITGLMIMGQMSVTYPFRVRLFPADTVYPDVFIRSSLFPRHRTSIKRSLLGTSAPGRGR
jgi:hypothetical protein